MPSPVVLIIGAGPNVGMHSARAFAAKGYKVALSSRSMPADAKSEGFTHYQADAADPSSVTAFFDKVKKELGPPTVVIYNAASRNPTDPSDPLAGITLEQFTHDFTINATSALIAAKEAVKSFAESPVPGSKTFIFTGNMLNSKPLPAVLNFGMGKSASAHLVHAASLAYAEKEWKFYYADERKPDGNFVGLELSGEAHAKLYLELAGDDKQREWLQTFIKGVGYTDFSKSKNV